MKHLMILTKMVVRLSGLFLLFFNAVALHAQAVIDEDALLSFSRSPWTVFEKKLSQAKKAGLAEQSIIEASILHELFNGDADRIGALTQDIANAQKTWNFERSRLAKDPTKLSAITEALLAKQGLLNGDEARFELHAKNAFWQDPDMAQLVGPWISDYRRAHRLKNFTVPMQTVFKTSQGEDTTLGKLVDGKKALLVDFWATWCAPCMQLMPTLVKKANALKPQDVVVVGMNSEGFKEAEGVRKSQKIDFPWLVEPKNGFLSQALMIESLPRMILISPEGKILYNGHPNGPGLKMALSALGATL